MIKRKKYLSSFIVLTLLSYYQMGMASERSSNSINFQINDSVKVKKGSSFYLNPREFTPLSFINAVTIPDETKNHSINVTTMTEFPEDWVKSSDLDSLITLIGSTTKCNCSKSPLSSHIPTNMNADIGGYAIIFINSFRQKKRISLGLYNCPKTQKESVEEIMKWWTDFKATN